MGWCHMNPLAFLGLNENSVTQLCSHNAFQQNRASTKPLFSVLAFSRKFSVFYKKSNSYRFYINKYALL